MDNLAKEAKLARQAKMSYGKWKAMQHPAKIYKEIPDGWRVCQWCGQPFKPKTKGPQKYCDINCQRQASRQRERQKKAEG